MAAFDNSQLRQQTQQLEWLIIWTKIEKTFSTHPPPPPPEELDRPICFAIDNASYRSVLALEDSDFLVYKNMAYQRRQTFKWNLFKTTAIHAFNEWKLNENI